MTETTQLTRAELEQIWESVNEQINVLHDEKVKLESALERLLRNREVFGALIELKLIKEEQQKSKDEVISITK